MEIPCVNKVIVSYRNLKAPRGGGGQFFKGKPQGVGMSLQRKTSRHRGGGRGRRRDERGKSDSLKDNIILTNSILRLKVHLICVQELKESIIHRIAELSDFYYAGKQRRKQSHLVDNDFEASLARNTVEPCYFKFSRETKNSLIDN